MSAADVDFREKVDWWITHCEMDVQSSAELERLYDEVHPPRVTADDVLREFNAILGTPPYRTVPAYVERMAYEIRDLRNAAREAPDDEAWIRDAARCLGQAVDGDFGKPGGFVENTAKIIRTAYRARAKK